MKMQKLMLSLSAFPRHILRLSEDLKIFLIFLFREHCSSLILVILGKMNFKDFGCYWKDVYAFTVQSKTFPQGCFQEFCSQGIIKLWRQSSICLPEKVKDNKLALPSICFLHLISFPQNIISDFKLFQSCCMIVKPVHSLQKKVNSHILLIVLNYSHSYANIYFVCMEDCPDYC